MNLPHFTVRALVVFVMLAPAAALRAQSPAGGAMPAVREAVAPFVEGKEVAGVVTMVVTPERVVHLDAQGWADVERQAPMKADSVFWIASMTKPVTAAAVLMLADEGKLPVDDPAAKYLPELGAMKNGDGSSVGTPITIKHLMTHTAGLPENAREETRAAKTLQDLVDAFAKKPMRFEPGAKWAYSQTAMNSLGRIVEVVSGKRFEDFLDERIFQPLGMADTTFYPPAAQRERIATSYRLDEGKLIPVEIHLFNGGHLAARDRVPLANGGLFSTAADYGKFVRMLLNDGSLDGRQYLKPETVKRMGGVHSGELATGFTRGNAWGLGVCVARSPQGVSAALSPGSFGHGGAYGTQAWVDPVKKVGYVLMVQRSNFPNADASDLRKAFQNAAAGALAKPAGAN